jgi:Na+-driven multidrug efflux pump
LFGDDATMNAVGVQYLQIVGPFYGFFGAGLALYFASQGAGRIGWNMVAALLRVAVAGAGGLLVAWLGYGTAGLFAALSTGLAIYGTLNIVAVAAGSWFPRGVRPRLPVRLAVEVAR